MNPEDRKLLEKAVRLSEENNRILGKVEARARRAAIYGFLKLVIVIAPFVIGYIFLEPYFDQAQANWKQVQELIGR